MKEERDTKNAPWKCEVKKDKFSDNFTLRVYTKPQKGKVNFMRSEAEMVGVDPHKMWDYMTNPPQNKMIKQNIIFDQKENECKQYTVMKLPLMSSRDDIT